MSYIFSHSSCSDITLGQIYAANRVLIEVQNDQLYQLKAALHELLDNYGLDLNVVQNDDGQTHIEVVNVKKEDENWPDQSWATIENVSNGQEITSETFDIDVSWDDHGTSIDIEFELNHWYGYWTRPGTLFFRCLGQGLSTFVWRETED